jgi:autotransporter-associated beta strand protein
MKTQKCLNQRRPDVRIRRVLLPNCPLRRMAASAAIGLLSWSSSVSAQVVVAGIDSWDSATAPTVPVTAPGITATATASGTNGNWSLNEGSGRGASNDGTWGTFNGNGTAPDTAIAPNGNYALTNGKQGAEVTLTITNNGASDLDLNAFHMDAGAFRPNAARAYSLDVLAGSDITVGNVFASAGTPMNNNSTDDITQVGGNLTPANDYHDDLDIDLTGLADSTLAVGETAIIQITFSAGTGSGSGHHLFLDNVAVSSVATTTDRLVITDSPIVDTTAGTDFSVTIQAQDSGGSPILVTQDTNVTLAASGGGTLTGNSGTIFAGTSTLILDNVQYDLAETITLSAFRTSGDDLLGSVASPSFNIVAGPASVLTIETAADGTGELLGDTKVILGDQIDFFAISRDASGNFVANEASAVFSLINISGGVVTEDLFDNEDGSAYFLAFDPGTCNVNAAASGFTDAVSGLITAAELVNRYDGGTNSSPNMSTAIVWEGDILPDFNNETDLFFSAPGTTKRSLYLGPDGGTTKSVRSVTFDEATTTGQNVSFVENGTDGTVNLIFDTDSTTEPAEFNVDAAFEATINFGSTGTSQAAAGDIILADNLLVTHNGTGLLDLRVDIIETGGSYGITKSGTGTAVLSGNNAYTGDTTVTDGVLRVTGQSIADTTSLIVTGGVVDVEADEYVVGLSLPGMPNLPNGEYGSTASGVAVPDDVNFTGTGKIIVGPPPVGGEIVISEVSRTGTTLTLTFTSTGNVDVYRSSDLINWGAPYAVDQPSGSYTDNAADGDKYFYILVSAGDPAP